MGVASGTLSAAFGVGGAVLSTPGIRLLGASAMVAVGTTLPSILPGAVAGTLRYLPERLIDWRAVRGCAPVGAVASVGGSLLSTVVPGEGHVLMLLTAALLGWTSWRMTTKAQAPPVFPAGSLLPEAEVGRVPSAGAPTPARRPVSGVALAAVGGAAGGLSGLLGVGGGIVIVPAFTEALGMSIKPAVATSLVCVGILSIPGAITHGLLGTIDWRIALALALGVLPGARIGAAITVRAHDHRLRLAAAAFFALVATTFALGEVTALMS